MPHLKEPNALLKTLIGAGLATNETLNVLFTGLDPRLRGTLDRGDTATLRLQSMVHGLNTQPDPTHLRQLLDNASVPATGTNAEKKLQQALEELQNAVGKTANHGKFTYFLAHASTDKPLARELHEKLVAAGVSCFLDEVNVLPGDEWDRVIRRAHQQSAATLVMVSPNYDAAYYLRDEVHSAISWNRKDENAHRVVPIFVDGIPDPMPYGLTIKQGLDLSKLGMDSLVESLVALVRQLGPGPTSPLPAPPAQNRRALFEALCLQDPKNIEQILILDLPEAADQVPSTGAFETRVLALVQWAALQGAEKLEELSQVIDRLQKAPKPNPSRVENPLPQIDVGILTIKEEEFDALLDRFPADPDLQRVGERRNYAVCRIDTPRGPCHVAMTRSSLQGNVYAQATATEMLDDLAPRYIVVVGIAGGVPTPDFTLGDVIVSSYIHDLTLEDTGTGTPRFNAMGGPLHPEATRIIDELPVFRRLITPWTPLLGPRPSHNGQPTTKNKDWNNAINEAFSAYQGTGRTEPLVRAERIASSDRLVKDPDLITAWRSVIKGIAAVEMETAGVYAVCQRRHIPCFAVRGISDIVGWRRDEEWTRYACRSAAAFFRSLVDSGVLTQRR